MANVARKRVEIDVRIFPKEIFRIFFSEVEIALKSNETNNQPEFSKELESYEQGNVIGNLMSKYIGQCNRGCSTVSGWLAEQVQLLQFVSIKLCWYL